MASIFLILFLIFFSPVLIEYFKTGVVPRFPTLIVSTLFGVIAILLWITGVILEIIAKKHKQLYELYMNQINIMKKDK